MIRQIFSPYHGGTHPPFRKKLNTEVTPPTDIHLPFVFSRLSLVIRFLFVGKLPDVKAPGSTDVSHKTSCTCYINLQMRQDNRICAKIRAADFVVCVNRQYLEICGITRPVLSQPSLKNCRLSIRSY